MHPRKFALLFFLLNMSHSITTIANPNQLFTRNDGFWSNQKDEANTNFFGKLTEPKSQRENWYTISSYIAEFWCMLSNMGFIYVGLKYHSPALLFAGVASIISHSIPKQWLLTVDKIGVVLVGLMFLKKYDVFMQKPLLLALLCLGGLINGADAYLARNKGYTTPHVIWHLSAAYIAHSILQQTA